MLLLTYPFISDSGANASEKTIPAQLPFSSFLEKLLLCRK
jgi:hypothetical protein